MADHGRLGNVAGSTSLVSAWPFQQTRTAGRERSADTYSRFTSHRSGVLSSRSGGFIHGPHQTRCLARTGSAVWKTAPRGSAQSGLLGGGAASAAPGLDSLTGGSEAAAGAASSGQLARTACSGRAFTTPDAPARRRFLALPGGTGPQAPRAAILLLRPS